MRRHPDKVNAKTRNRQARKRGNGGTHTIADIAWLMEKQKKRCAHLWCRRSLKEGYQVDHILPLAKDGPNDRKNLQLLCQPCNSRKSDTHPVDFAQQHGMLL
jgi:5-methylcytosine-specific restriction endonuclease McrA